MGIKSTNRIERPKDYGRMYNNYDSFGGDLTQPVNVSMKEDYLSTSDFSIIEETTGVSAFNGVGATITLDVDTNGGTLQKVEILINGTGGYSADLEVYNERGALIFEYPSIAAGVGWLTIDITTLIDTKEKSGGYYRSIITKTNVGNINLEMKLKRYLFKD